MPTLVNCEPTLRTGALEYLFLVADSDQERVANGTALGFSDEEREDLEKEEDH